MVYILWTAFVLDISHNVRLSPTIEIDRHHGTAREL